MLWNILPEVGHAYGTAQLKLYTHFGLLVIVHRFYLSHSSMLMCFVCCSCSVTNLTHEWQNLTFTTILHKSQISLCIPQEGMQAQDLIPGTHDFLINSFLVYRHNRKISGCNMARLTNKHKSYHTALQRPCTQLLIFTGRKHFYQLTYVCKRRCGWIIICTLEGTDKFICKPLILDEKQLLKQAKSKSHKSDIYH